VAGSGKTVLLISRAKMLSQQTPEAEILVLCYNVSLAAYLRCALATCGNVSAGAAFCPNLRLVGAGEENRILFYNGQGERFGETMLSEAPDTRMLNDAKQPRKMAA
jgi:hypothetical protein